MTEYAERFEANPQQAEFWNTGAGHKWAEHQATMDARLAPMTEELLRRAAVRAGEHVLDIGCGCGATVEQVAGAIGPAGSVLGLDLSQPMLEVARRRCAALGQVTLEHADAQIRAFEPERFDLLISRFGVMFFSNPYAAFANLARAMRPPGRLCFVCWAPLEDNPWFTVRMEAVLRHLDPPEPSPPRAPGPLAFSDQGYVREILGHAGFTEIGIERFETAMRSEAGREEQAQFFLTFGPAARLIAAQQPSRETVQAIAEGIGERLASYETEAGISVPATVFYVQAQCG